MITPLVCSAHTNPAWAESWLSGVINKTLLCANWTSQIVAITDD